MSSTQQTPATQIGPIVQERATGEVWFQTRIVDGRLEGRDGGCWVQINRADVVELSEDDCGRLFGFCSL